MPELMCKMSTRFYNENELSENWSLVVTLCKSRDWEGDLIPQFTSTYELRGVIVAAPVDSDRTAESFSLLTSTTKLHR
jgi:hypothetical protein